jgi:TPR repeat protein
LMHWPARVRAKQFCPDSIRLHILKALRLVTLLPLIAAVACAQQSDDLAAPLGPAQEALAAGNYDAAYKHYLHFAEDENNPLAQFSVGLFYQLGWGRPVNDAEACRWFAQAAEGNIPGALLAHADCLRYGKDGEAAPAEAAHYYQKAADAGLPTALCSLAELYMAGEGVPYDPAKAITLCTSVAQQGYPAAINRVGLFYLEGDESIRDNEKALQWFVAGANAGDPEAMYNLGRMMRSQLVADSSREDARQWFEKAAAQGYEPAYFQTAELYYLAKGQGENNTISEDDLAKLYMWLQVALQSSTDQAERDKAGEMLEQVLLVMPVAWQPALDQRVAEHLQKFGGI